MKTFNDLDFKIHPMGYGHISRLQFDNGWGVSVVQGPHTYGGEEGLYELGVLKDNELHYKNHVANGDVIGYLNEEEVTHFMIEIQNFKNEPEGEGN